MTPEELDELRARRELYAGIALPGLLYKHAGTYMTNKNIAQEAFAIADVMIRVGDETFKEVYSEPEKID